MNSVTEQFCRNARKDDPNAKPDDLTAQLAADQRLSGRIQIYTLKGYLTGTLLFQPYCAFKGSSAMGEDGRPVAPLPPQLAPFVPAFAELEYILNNLPEVQTDVPQIATEMNTLVGAFQSGGLLSDSDVSGFLQLGGGRLYETPTPEEITALFAADDRETSDTTLVNRCVDALNAIKDLIRGSDPQPDHSALVKAFEVALG